MVHSNSLSCYKPELITESYIPLIISNFSSECSVNVPHMTDSVDGALLLATQELIYYVKVLNVL